MHFDSRSQTQAVLLTQLVLFLAALIANEFAVINLFLIAILFPLLSRDLRADVQALVALYIVIVVHFAVTLINASSGPTIGAELDAETFHEGAKGIVKDYTLSVGFDYIFYENFLALFYYCFGAGRSVGGSVSLIAFTIATIVYGGILKQLKLETYRVPLYLVFGLFPSTVLLTSVTLRESWELLFLLSCIYCILRYFQDGLRKTNWLLAGFVFSVMLGMLHKALLFYGPFMIILALLISALGAEERKDKWVVVKYMVIISLAAAGLVVLVYQIPVGRSMIFFFLNDDPFSVIDTYRTGVDLHGSARSAFHIPFETGSIMQTLGTFAQIYLHYMFAPIGSPPEVMRDWYAIIEAFLRLTALVLCIYGFARINNFRSESYLFLGVFYLSATFLWALGTTNYGQAIRHHILTNWTLFTLAAPVLAMFAKTLMGHWSNKHLVRRCEGNLH